MPNICFITLNFDLSFIVILISGFIQGLFEVVFKKVNWRSKLDQTIEGKQKGQEFY